MPPVILINLGILFYLILHLNARDYFIKRDKKTYFIKTEAKADTKVKCKFGEPSDTIVDGQQEKGMGKNFFAKFRRSHNIGLKHYDSTDSQEENSSNIPMSVTNCTPKFIEENVIFHGIPVYSRNATSWVDCLTRCEERSVCMFWTFTYEDKVCCLKKTGGGEITRAYSSGVISGISRTGDANGKVVLYEHPDNAGHRRQGGPRRQTTESPCIDATVNISKIKHSYAEDGLEASRLAFASCYGPESVTTDNYWRHVRNIFRPDVFAWLGDNAYKDGNDINEKRIAYNAARDHASYISHGPVREVGKIPVMATWDDHDYASDNMGKEYPCKIASQNEFVNHFNIPSTDPRHSQYPDGQQTGVYNARMFRQPGTRDNGIHMIMLDARVNRDPTYSSIGSCLGAESRFLSDTQWTWLDQELNKSSVVKIIGSGIQVLMPTNLKNNSADYCADDSHSSGSTSTFMDAIESVGEDSSWEGTHFESWGEIPQERAKLLGKVQKSINDGKTRVAIFLSGDQHWSELMTKRMPNSTTYGPSQLLHEITSSGVYKHWNNDIQNSNRLKERSPENDLANITMSNSTKTCSNSKFHVCNAQATYGAVEVDFENSIVKMSIFSPDEQEVTSHEVSF